MDFENALTRQKLAQLFRYAQIGQCVNSVTHDVNNYLGAIMAYAELVGLDKGVSKESNRMLGEIISAVRRSSALVGNLTDIARKERADVRILSPTQIVERVIDLRRYDLKVMNASLETRYDEDLVSIAVDLPKIEQALIYLMANAIEAVEDCQTRLVRIFVTQDEEQMRFIFWDSGPIISEAQREEIFEPFFTTKDGAHLGLGLPVSRDTARFHGGDLTYDPEEGFIMRIPLRNNLSH